MKHNGRLPKSVKGQFVKRRLDMVTEKNQLIQDILQLAGSSDLDSLQSELGDFGESVSEVLPRLSLPRLRRIHARTVSGTLDIPWVEEF